MDMVSGRLVVRCVILLLIFGLIWKIWQFTEIASSPSSALQETREEMDGVSHSPLRVSVYYEALCPDSRYFVLKQLKPTYEKLHNIMTIALVPYGKAETTEQRDGGYAFTCQHGALECLANRVHACVCNLVKEEAKQLDIVSCMIDRNDQPLPVGKRCVEKYGEEWSSVIECVESAKGASILKHMGDLTHSLNPKVSFIPTVEIDGSQEDQNHIQQDLHKVLCRRYKGPPPPSC